MTLPNALRDKLIRVASRRRSPSASEDQWNNNV